MPRARLVLASTSPLSARAAGAPAAAVRRRARPQVDEARARRRDAGRDRGPPGAGEGRCGRRARRRGGRDRLRPGRRPRRPRHRQARRPRARDRAAARRCAGAPSIFQTAVAVVCRASGFAPSALVPVTVRFRDLERRRDRALPARRDAVRLRRQRQDRDPRHRPRRERRLRRSDRADRPAADPHLRAAAPAGIDPLGQRVGGRRHDVRAARSIWCRTRSTSAPPKAAPTCGERLPLGTLAHRRAPRPLGVREREDDTRLPEARRCRCARSRGRCSRSRSSSCRARRRAAATTPASTAHRLLAPALAGNDLGLLCGSGPAGGRRSRRAARRSGARGRGCASSLCPVRARSRSRSRRAASTARALPSSATCRSRPPRATRASASSRRRRAASAQTQVVIETPYRNAGAARRARRRSCSRRRVLSVSVGLTLGERIDAQRLRRALARGAENVAGRRAGGVLVPGALRAASDAAQVSAAPAPCRRTARRPSSSA